MKNRKEKNLILYFHSFIVFARIEPQSLHLALLDRCLYTLTTHGDVILDYPKIYKYLSFFTGFSSFDVF